MRVALIARSEDRGLGHLSRWMWDRYSEWADVAVITLPADERQHPSHPEWFSVDRGDPLRCWRYDTTTGTVVGDWRAWCDGVDVVVVCETFYDWQIVAYCRARGVRTVCMGMPEFFRHHENPLWPQPDVWWWPTSWLPFPGLPSGVIEMPTWPAANPMAAEADDDGPLRVVHVAGAPTWRDRNGTNDLLRSLPHLKSWVDVTVWSHQPLDVPSLPSNVSCRVELARPADEWEMYAGAHIMVMPRRYGGLCLPAIEAACSGVVPVLPAVAPNAVYHVAGRMAAVPAVRRPLIRLPAGSYPATIVDRETIAATIDMYAEDRYMVRVDHLATRKRAASASTRKALPAIVTQAAADVADT